LFPYGGRYDDGRGGKVNGSFGRGVVAQRLLPYTSRKFLEAEAQLTILNNRAAAKVALEAALRASFAKVNAIAQAEISAGGSPAPTNLNGSAAVYPTAIPATSRALTTIPGTEIDTYVTAALARFDGTNTIGPIKTPLQVIMEEKYVASFGMGTDLYTDWRRTSFPIISVPDNANIGANNPGLVEDGDPATTSAGLFPRRLPYSQTALTANPNPSAPKVLADPTSRIFWDQ
jgi:hypothetical protein